VEDNVNWRTAPHGGTDHDRGASNTIELFTSPVAQISLQVAEALQINLPEPTPP
jgi:hypothetical protein